ncbi:3-oxoacyl-[acyl-carrier-protein] synthase III [Striga asiatica]|uniref:3-oxoacyl-[acyl-carrier-protein] synthase III n=1 Tax=Striga asiatica TaxID=4170 RepID=A0A5A7R3R6_STRAF|nr:3-oxoacyl-[acyl-carrier-protein] synthase III [Striga asiatica]
MANASGIYFPAAHSVGRRFSPSIGIYRFGFWFSEGATRRTVCSGTTHGAEKLSGSDSRAPRLESRGCKLVGCGSAVPSLQISNDDLSKIVDTNDEWISVRTGIRNRRIVSGKDSLTGLAVEASKKALEMAGVTPDDVDLVLLCTSTPEDLFGSAPQVHLQMTF